MHEAVEGGVIGLVADRFGDTAVERNAQVDAPCRIGNVLVDEARCETGERIGSAGNGHLGLGVSTDAREDAIADVEQPVAHPVTPTRTPRNRHGTDGCPVWPIWPGCPLPQFGVPQKVHSDSLPSMSRLAQNRGPMPV